MNNKSDRFLAAIGTAIFFVFIIILILVGQLFKGNEVSGTVDDSGCKMQVVVKPDDLREWAHTYICNTRTGICERLVLNNNGSCQTAYYYFKTTNNSQKFLTREQMIEGINTRERQGKSQQEIQGWLDSLPRPSHQGMSQNQSSEAFPGINNY